MRDARRAAARRGLPPGSGSRRSTRCARGCCGAKRRPSACRATSSSTTRPTSSSVVKQAMKSLDIDDKLMPPRAALARISQAKNRMESPEAMRVDRLEPARSADQPGLRGLSARADRRRRARLRRPAAQDASSSSRRSERVRELLRAQVPVRPRRRVPGHEPAAVPAHPAAGRGAPQPLRRRRSRSVDLPLARRRPAQHPRLRAATFPTRTSSSSSRTTARRRSFSTPRRPSSAATAIARTSGSGPTSRAASAFCYVAPATKSRRPTSSRAPIRETQRRGPDAHGRRALPHQRAVARD